MEREREKQERLENLRQLQELEQFTECTFQPRLIKGGKAVNNVDYYGQAHQDPEESYQDPEANVHERLYERRNSANATRQRNALALAQAREREEDELKECTFKPKINTNVKVPTDRTLFAKPSYTKRFNERKEALQKQKS